MSSVSIQHAQEKYGSSEEAVVVSKLAVEGGYRRVYKYKGRGEAGGYTDYKLIRQPGDAQERAMFESKVAVLEPILVYDDGPIYATARRSQASDAPSAEPRLSPGVGISDVPKRSWLARLLGRQRSADTLWVDSCFQLDFKEVHEERTFGNCEELQRVKELMTSGQDEEARILLDSLQDRFADFNCLYYWRAILAERVGDIDSARKAIHDGLQNAKSKYALCEKMAEVELDMGSFAEAVRWWIRGTIARLEAKEKLAIDPLIHLGHIAHALRDEESAKALFHQVDKIMPSGPRLFPRQKKLLAEKAAGHGDRPIQDAIKRLCNKLKS